MIKWRDILSHDYFEGKKHDNGCMAGVLLFFPTSNPHLEIGKATRVIPVDQGQSEGLRVRGALASGETQKIGFSDGGAEEELGCRRRKL